MPAPRSNKASSKKAASSSLTRTAFSSELGLSAANDSPKLSKGERTKLEMLHAAIHLLSEKGLDGANLGLLANHLGVVRAHVAYYFKDSNDLLIQALRLVALNAQTITVEQVMKAQTPMERVDAISQGALRWFRRYPEQTGVILISFFLTRSNPEIQKYHAEIRTIGQGRIAAILEATGAPQAKTASLARQIQDYLAGVMTAAFILKESSQRLVEIEEQAIAHVRKWLLDLKSDS